MEFLIFAVEFICLIIVGALVLVFISALTDDDEF